MSQQISQSRSRHLGLESGVETKSRFLNLDRNFSIVETSFLKVSRFSQLSRQAFFGVEIESLDRDHVETNQDPQAYQEGITQWPKKSILILSKNLGWFDKTNST
jgi:hypothetical protein